MIWLKLSTLFPTVQTHVDYSIGKEGQRERKQENVYSISI